MKHRLLIVLLLSSLTGWGQVFLRREYIPSNSIQVPGSYILRLDTAGRLKAQGKTGTEFTPKVDYGSVLKLPDSLNVYRTKAVTTPDTTLRPGTSGQGALRAMGNNIYLVPQTGNAVQVTASLKSFSELSGVTHKHVLYDGSIWVRLPVTSNLTPVISTTAVGYGAMFSAPQNGYFYARTWDGTVNAKWFGFRTDIPLPNDTVAISAPLAAMVRANRIALQSVVNYVCGANASAQDGIYPLARNRANRLYISGGTGYIDSTVNIPGSLTMFGDGGLQNGGTVIANRSNGYDMFSVTGNGFGGNMALQVSEMRFRGHYASGTIFNIPAGASQNSIYFDRVWFQKWAESSYAMIVGRCDDFQIINCTFDTGSGGGLYLGDPSNINNGVSNIKIQGCTFFQMPEFVRLNNVSGFLFSGNTCYKSFGVPNLSIGIDALTSCIRADRVSLTGNTFTGVNRVFATSKNNAIVSHNTIQGADSRVIEIGGGGVVSGLTVTDNVITMTQSTTNPAASAIYASGTGVTYSTFRNKIIDSTGTSTTAMYFPDARTTANHMGGSDITGFSVPYVVANPASNELSASNTTYLASGNIQTMNLKSGTYLAETAVTGMPTTGEKWNVQVSHNEVSDGTGGGPYWTATARKQSDPTQIWTGGLANTTWLGWTRIPTVTSFPVPSQVYTYTATSGWTDTTAYHEIIPEATLSPGHRYAVVVRVVKSGVGQFTESFDFNTEMGSPTSPVYDRLFSQPTHFYKSTDTFHVRAKVVTTNLNVVGAEGKFSNSAYAGGTVTVSVTPIL